MATKRLSSGAKVTRSSAPEPAPEPQMTDENGKKKARTVDWAVPEIDYLIDLWEADYTALEETRKRGPLFQKISDALAHKGYYRSALQVQKKIQWLKEKYRYNKHAPDWPHIEKLQKLFQNDPSLNGSFMFNGQNGSETGNGTTNGDGNHHYDEEEDEYDDEDVPDMNGHLETTLAVSNTNLGPIVNGAPPMVNGAPPPMMNGIPNGRPWINHNEPINGYPVGPPGPGYSNGYQPVHDDPAELLNRTLSETAKECREYTDAKYDKLISLLTTITGHIKDMSENIREMKETLQDGVRVKKTPKKEKKHKKSNGHSYSDDD